MQAIKNLVRAINHWTHRVILIVGEISLIAMVIIVAMTVLLRYVFNTGIGWAEEVPRLLVTLFSFIAMAMGVRDHAHIGVNIIYNLFPGEGLTRRLFIIFGDVCVLICGIFMLYYGASYCITLSQRPGTMPMTGMRTWIQYLPIPIAGFVISFDSILFLTGLLPRDDLLYTEKEKADSAARQAKEAGN